MKTYKSVIYFCGVLFMTLFVLAGCKEDDTLNGAEEVYIEIISPRNNSSITLGQKIALKVAVTNVSGDTIHTPVEWMVDDASVLSIANDTLTAIPGSVNKITNIRVKLENGKYAVAQVKVIVHIPEGVAPLLDGPYYSYNSEKDTVWFTVRPKGLLLDYEPKITNSDPTKIMPHENYQIIDKETGMVGYAFASPRGVVGRATIGLTIGPEGNKVEGSTEVVLCPAVVATFGTDFNPTALVNSISKIMDINSTDTIWVNTESAMRYQEDFVVAAANYDWSFSGGSGMISVFGAIQAGNGHKAWAEVKSSPMEGQLIVKYNCYGNTLTATVDVQNYKIRYPVEQLLVDKETLSVPMEATVFITPSVLPESSYAFHLPKFESENPLVAKIGKYEGTAMRIDGVSIGKTNIIITSNGKRVVVPVQVTEKVDQMLWVSRQLAMFEGMYSVWEADVVTSSGSTYPAQWTSSDETIVKVEKDEKNNEVAKVIAVAPGEATIIVEAGGKKTDPATLKVLAIPSDVTFTDENTDLDGNSAYYDSDKLVVSIGAENAMYRVWNIYVSNVDSSGDFTGTYDAATHPMTAEIDGARCNVQSGSITLSGYNDNGMRTYTINLTLEAGGKTFKVDANNLLGW